MLNTNDLNRLIDAVDQDKPETFHGDYKHGLLEALSELSFFKESLESACTMAVAPTMEDLTNAWETVASIKAIVE